MNPVVAVVLNYAGEMETRRCVASVAGQAGVLIVDNASPDGSGARLADAGEVLALPANLGFAGGMNAGAARAFARGATHVLLLNHDAVLAPDAVARLLAADAPIVAPTIVHGLPPAAGPLWWAGGDVDWAGVAQHGRAAPTTDDPRSVGFASGCCLLVTRAAWAALDGLDPRYFLYHEDADLALRARSRGLAIMWAPAARAWHEGGAATGSQAAKAPLLDYYDARNGLLLIRRHLRGPRAGAALAYWAAVRLPRKLLRILLTAPDRRASLAAALEGARDGLRGRTGPRP